MSSLTCLQSPKIFDNSFNHRNPYFTNGNRGSLPVTKTPADEESSDEESSNHFAKLNLSVKSEHESSGKLQRGSLDSTVKSEATKKTDKKDNDNSSDSNETRSKQHYRLKYSYSSGTVTLMDWNRVEIHEAVGRGAFSVVYKGKLRDDKSQCSSAPSSSSLIDILIKSCDKSSYSNKNKSGKKGGKQASIVRKICEKNPSGQDVAVKIFSEYKDFHIPDEALKDDKWKKTFIKEVFIASKVPPHKNLIRIFGVCTNPELCLIMEYCIGGTLYKRLTTPNRHSEITWTLGIRWFKEILTAVQYLHNCFPRIVHRDLKSLNILLSHQSLEKATLKIADFGLSKVSGELLSQNELSTSSNHMTVPYCAPEIFKESCGFSFASDAYAIGIIFWEIATRIIDREYETPFCGGLEKEKEEDRKFSKEPLTQIQVIARVLFDGIRPRMPEKCPISLKKLIRRLWASDPSERPVIDPKLLEEIETIFS